MKEQRGFSLIEILIVVVIVALLASLIIPRLLSAPEKAIVGEANRLLGGIIRAEQANMDLGASFIAITDNTSTSTWGKLGLQTPGAAVLSGTGSKFLYVCASPNCTATRTGAANKVVMLKTDGTWSCGSDYTTLAYGGCTLA